MSYSCHKFLIFGRILKIYDFSIVKYNVRWQEYSSNEKWRKRILSWNDSIHLYGKELNSQDEQIMFMILYTIINKVIFLKQICTQAKLLDWQLFLYGGMGNIIINVNTFTHLLNKSRDWFIERRYIYILLLVTNLPTKTNKYQIWLSKS